MHPKVINEAATDLSVMYTALYVHVGLLSNIILLVLSTQWGMLPCGHPLCMDCLFALSRKYHCGVSGRSEAVRLSCPLCRFSFVSSEVNIVRPTEEEDVEIKVSREHLYSTLVSSNTLAL